jgi:hypothetical protein
VDALLDSMTSQEFEQWQVYDRVQPLNHGDRMLGLIAFMLACYFGVDTDRDELRKICMPWDDDQEISGSDAAKILKAVPWQTSAPSS